MTNQSFKLRNLRDRGIPQCYTCRDLKKTSIQNFSSKQANNITLQSIAVSEQLCCRYNGSTTKACVNLKRSLTLGKITVGTIQWYILFIHFYQKNERKSCQHFLPFKFSRVTKAKCTLVIGNFKYTNKYSTFLIIVSHSKGFPKYRQKNCQHFCLCTVSRACRAKNYGQYFRPIFQARR